MFSLIFSVFPPAKALHTSLEETLSISLPPSYTSFPEAMSTKRAAGRGEGWGRRKYSGKKYQLIFYSAIGGYFLIKPQQSCEVNTTIVPILYMKPN